MGRSPDFTQNLTTKAKNLQDVIYVSERSVALTALIFARLTTSYRPYLEILHLTNSAQILKKYGTNS